MYKRAQYRRNKARQLYNQRLDWVCDNTSFWNPDRLWAACCQDVETTGYKTVTSKIDYKEWQCKSAVRRDRRQAAYWG